MRSTFSGFEIAKSGIYTSQTALNVTGHNIANAETPGYTRQRLDLAASYPYGTLVKMAPVEQGIYGNGVRTQQVMQIRDQFLDREFRQENTALNYWSVKASGLNAIQGMFPASLDKIELQNLTENFFSSWAKLSTNPSDQGIRSNVLQNGIALASSLNGYHARYVEMRANENDKIKAGVDQVNTLASEIAALNEQIYKFEQGGHPANDLRDTLNYKLDQLSGYVEITYKNDDQGRLQVSVGGDLLVDYNKANKIDATPDADGMYQLEWADGSGAVNLTNNKGELKARMDLRDGGTSDNAGIPYFMKQLDILAEGLIKAVNDLHNDGVDLDGKGGWNFFDGTGAGDIAVSIDVLDQPRKVVASDDDPNAPGNNRIALLISELWDKKDTVDGTSFDGFLVGMLANIGTETNMAMSQAESSLTMAKSIENQRLSLSGVSLDEEMTNLIRFQHAYSAAARALTTMDEALDVLINRTGKVGL